ncbi:sugar phosphate nucleotidyltransferase [Guptibacillus hwajinpoensis]|uniref:sugar phosphate nucleotidyltransferase n=1 Tax=Guptibacillus hwajinpoensis TaxID=208199 RepID=UPI001CFD3AA6|nr:sugar phosphate nucleotidyltransferase [Pseudalkalibacillus hwajinpoensis]WLR61558.1 sugar phosphate nucleotidyltransferase [Pseudalkalibacillus hwajinpoensis]
MHTILLSGGSGKRLWPLSNDARSKQFLKVLTNTSGDLESMVQKVWKQLCDVNLSSSSIIATSKSQVEMLQNQIGQDVPIVVEPMRRDTFPAIALAASYLYSKKNCELNEVIGVLPVDSFVNNDFFSKVKELENSLKKSQAEIALIGVKPTYPSEKYGYIIPKKHQGIDEYLEVEKFTEKPSEKQAELLIEEKALWNCGVFGFKLKYILDLLIERGLPIDYEELLMNYEKMDKNSFDYEVVEKSNKVIAIPYSGEWKDLGTWNTLTEEMALKVTGKGLLSEELLNTHIVNELDIPISVLGLSNIVVAASPDGILVSDKDASPKVKELVNNIDQRPMYEERRWGWYKVLDHTKLQNRIEVLTKRLCIKSGQFLSYHSHQKRSEVWTVLDGVGEVVLNGETKRIISGDVLKIPIGAKHAIKAVTDLEIIEVQSGTELIEEDINRIYTDWNQIKEAILA